MSQLATERLLSHLDEQHQTPLWRAFERFSGTLDQEEKAAFSDATLHELLFKVKDLDRKHAISSPTRNISRCFEPLIYFLNRHARALDCIVQAQPMPSAIIWGVFRVLLEVRLSSRVVIQIMLNVKGFHVFLPIFQEISCHG